MNKTIKIQEDSYQTTFAQEHPAGVLIRVSGKSGSHPQSVCFVPSVKIAGGAIVSAADLGTAEATQVKPEPEPKPEPKSGKKQAKKSGKKGG